MSYCTYSGKVRVVRDTKRRRLVRDESSPTPADWPITERVKELATELFAEARRSTGRRSEVLFGVAVQESHSTGELTIFLRIHEPKGRALRLVPSSEVAP